MLFALAFVLLAVWFLAIGLFNVTGAFAHIFLVLAMVSLGWHLVEKRRKAPRRVA